MSDSPEIVSFGSGVAPQHSAPDAAHLLSGQPKLTAWNHYEESSGQFFSGVWAGTRGSWRVSYTEHEFCHLLEGRIVITSAAGVRREFKAGDTFVIPAGFSGVWEVLEDCRKLYVIFEPKSGAAP